MLFGKHPDVTAEWNRGQKIHETNPPLWRESYIQTMRLGRSEYARKLREFEFSAILWPLLRKAFCPLLHILKRLGSIRLIVSSPYLSSIYFTNHILIETLQLIVKYLDWFWCDFKAMQSSLLENNKFVLEVGEMMSIKHHFLLAVLGLGTVLHDLSCTSRDESAWITNYSFPNYWLFFSRAKSGLKSAISTNWTDNTRIRDH